MASKKTSRQLEYQKKARHLRLVDKENPELGDAGSIEQKLDMMESGPLRGDEILHEHGVLPKEDREQQDRLSKDEDPNELPTEEEMLTNFRVDMSEPNREGDEMSGDEHSLGLQGGESELNNQETTDSGLPGDETAREKYRVKKAEK